MSVKVICGCILIQETLACN